MKKIILIVFLLIFGTKASFCAEPDYRQIYLDLQVPTFSYVHGIDPGQYYDNKASTWSPYPLFRLSSTLYFKTIAIPPGYYLLTPKTYKGDDYVLFKENGVIKYTIPVYKKEFVPEGFYDSHIPKPKLTKTQRMNRAFFTWVGKTFKRAQKKPTPQAYLEINELDNKFVSVIVYWGPYRYYMIFRTIQI